MFRPQFLLTLLGSLICYVDLELDEWRESWVERSPEAGGSVKLATILNLF